MIPIKTIEELILKHSSLEKDLSSGEIDKKLFAEKSKEYSNLNDIIKEAKSMGLRVFTEIGKKKPVSPMKSDDAIKAVLEDLEAGSEHVILESAETKLLRENNMIDVLPTIAKAVGLEHIYFELRRGYNLEQPWMELCEWLVQSLGPEINVMNIKVDECVWVDRIRYPLTTNQNLH